ncbi:Oxidoreductase, short-chain dehydrogenase/reductase family [Candidatus Nitrosotalea sp. TS]|uniref:SDR family oxidoreductase n=1 Tax=Candidatus Nitrosotalea sp. TS TaxID=2341020 RepID=UPI0014080148|nr:SDR family oxidoreductase [Candidatus Nitrosotalea sp. TS]NHI04133.1 Oxidoreductase, short-chain dehydrogenase/reductase family [Candidatus Nitrosotalea sp. TS]
MNYSGKTVVITGASSGIGKESALKFAKLHASIVLVSRDKDKLEEVAKELSKYQAQILVCACDISQKDQVNQMGKKVLEKFGTVDILVNNAGFGIYGTFDDLKVEEIESQMGTNYLGMIYCTKTFLPKMLEQKSGHIVNVASVAASFGIPGMTGYCASKFAMLGFSESLYHELKGTGVGITVVSPIMVKTSFFDHNSFNKMPRYTIALSASTVAKAVVQAASSPRLEIVVPQFVRIAIWFKQTFPYLVNLIVGAIFRKSKSN